MNDNAALRALTRLLTVPLFLFCLAGCEPYPTDDLEAAGEAAAELDWAQSARLLQRYLRDEMDETRRWEAWKLLAQSHERMGERQWLVETLETMLHEYEKDPERLKWILRELGTAYESVRAWDRASDTWLQLLDVAELSDSDAARLYEHMGMYYQRERKFDLAEDMFSMALEYAEDTYFSALCRYQIAYTYYLEDKFDDALALIEEILALPEYSERLKKGRRDASLSREDELLGRALLLKGDMLETREKKDEALACFRQAGNWYPNPEVTRKREELLRDRKNVTPMIQGK